jgi:hypothetical protein
MRTLLLAGVAAVALVGVAESASAAILREFSSPATYYPYPGPYPTGYLDPVAPSEPWTYGSFTPILDANGASTTDVGWGSPGVSRGLTGYNGPGSASDFEIVFGQTLTGVQAMLDPAQIALGMTQGCAGQEGGGTVFCGPTGPTGALGQWAVTAYGPNWITFTGPPGTDMEEGQQFFVNIMLLDGGGGAAFSGAWTGGVPEPSTWAMMLIGFAGLGFAGYRARKPSAALAV